MKLLFSSLNHCVVIIDTGQSDSLVVFSMGGVFIGFEVTCVLFVKVNELFVHRGRTCDQVGVLGFTDDLQNLGQRVLVVVINIINLVNCNKMAIT